MNQTCRTNSDTRIIQTAIDLAEKSGENKAVVPRINPRTGQPLWEIGEPILLPSDFTLVLDNCTLRLADGVYCNMFCNRNAYTEEGEPQKGISVVGIGQVVLDGGTPNGLTEKTAGQNGLPDIIHNTMLFFRNVSDFTVENIHIREQRWWGMTFMYCCQGRISNIRFSAGNSVPNQDGIDLRAGCRNIVIENIFGETGDDTIALTGVTGKMYRTFRVKDKSDDICGIVIRNVCACVSGGHHIVRLLNQDGIQLYDILIDGILDTSQEITAKAALKIGDSRYSKIRRAALHETRNITARNIISRAKAAVLFGCTAADSYFSNIQQYGGYALQGLDCQLENICIDGVLVSGGGLYRFENAAGKEVNIHHVIKPTDPSLSVCDENLALGID